jgi:chorismate dehydratase
MSSSLKIPLRFGFHDFLNAQPLLVPLQEIAIETGFKLVLGNPAATAQALEMGDLDLAMIPVVEYLKNAGNYKLLPGVSIASKGSVDTVLLVAKKSLNKIKTVAIDNRSKTSVAAIKILFETKFSRPVIYQPQSPELEIMLDKADAALIIGDNAHLAKQKFPDLKFYDIGEEWFIQTQKLFVHAAVAIRKGVELPRGFAQSVLQARKKGVARIPQISKSKAEKYGWSEQEALDYLSGKIIYDLGHAELEGLRQFRDLCYEKEITKEKVSIHILGQEENPK